MNRTVGQQLRQAREQLGISLDDAARQTHIRLNYLQELESDHPELLHSAAQARGFLRLYAQFLKLSYYDLAAQWDALAPQPQPEAQPERKPALPWLRRRTAQTEQQPQDTPAADQSSDAFPSEQEVLQPQAGLQNATDETGDGQSQAIEKEKQEQDSSIEPAQKESEQPEPIEPHSTKSLADKINLRRIAINIAAAIRNFKLIKKVREVGGKRQADLDAEVQNQAPEQHQTSDDVFIEIGLSLRARRELMELSLSDIENFTNLKRAFLIAIEDGRFTDLPSTVQGRGMLNNYAQFLGMESSSVMDRYARALQLLREERQQPRRQSTQPAVSLKVNLPQSWRRILNPDLIIGAVFIIGLFTFIIWGTSQVLRGGSGGADEAPSISDILQATPSGSPDLDSTPSAEPPGENPLETALPGVTVLENTPTVIATVNAAPLQLYIIAHDRAYVRVTVDGIEEFTGRVKPDSVYTFSGQERISLTTGNAAALEVYFNQDYLGKLGRVGQVLDINFTLQGLITPTPQPSSTSQPEEMPGE